MKLSGPIRNMSPCNACGEKFEACHSCCPKDARGEFGYGAWKKELDKVNASRKKYGRLPHVKDYGY